MSLAKRKTANKAEASYQSRVRELGVCVVCEFRRRHGMLPPTEPVPGALVIHHRNLGDMHGAKQLGQHAVVLLCDYHHDDKFCFFGWSPQEMREVYGPSFGFHARDFRIWTQIVLPGYGRGTEAWQRYQDELLEIEE